MVNQKGFEKKPVGGGKAVGPQGAGGSQLNKGGKVYGTMNPRGIEPQSHGGGMGGMVQMPVQPKVGK